MSISRWLGDPTTSHQAVTDLVHRRWGQVQHAEYEISLALWRLRRDNVHRNAAFSRFSDYAEQTFGIRGKLASLFCFLGRHMERLPKIRAALESGELTYTKAREFVAIATAEDEQVWIDYARSHTNREVERKCKRAREGTERDTKEVKSTLDPTQVQTVRKAREIVTKATGKPVPPDQALSAFAECVVNASAGDLFSASTAVSKPRPYLTINLCPHCTHTYVPTPGENLKVPVGDWFEALQNGAEVHDLVADLLCDCDDVKHRRDRCPHGNGRPPKGEAPKNRHVPAHVWQRIEARDGHRCRVPGCGNEVPLEKSHLKPYREGTPATTGTLAQHCATCNDLIETGRLEVKGEAPLEQYFRADGTFVGDGFDPVPHVGKKPVLRRKGDRDPPQASPGAA